MQNGAPTDVVRRPASDLPSDFPRRRRIGWNPYEAGFVAIAAVLILAAGFLPWWGFEIDRSVIPYLNLEGSEFGPWLGTDWVFITLPGAIRRRAEVLFWWDYVNVHPEFGSYAAIAPVLIALWGGSLGLALYALIARRKPRTREGGRPSLAQVSALVGTGSAVVLAFLAFPPMAGYPSFLGSSERIAWGPEVGWFLSLLAIAALSASSWIGVSIDRRLKGRCWSCHRRIEEELCPHCHAVQ